LPVIPATFGENQKGGEMLKEFKAFAMQGSVLDMAVGIIIGAAFGKIVSSLVGDVLMPPLGLLIGNVNFSNLYFNLSGQSFASLTEAKAVGAPVMSYGLFFNTVIDFIVVAFVIFLLVKQINRLKTGPPRRQRIPRTVPTAFPPFLFKPAVALFARRS